MWHQKKQIQLIPTKSNPSNQSITQSINQSINQSTRMTATTATKIAHAAETHKFVSPSLESIICDAGDLRNQIRGVWLAPLLPNLTIADPHRCPLTPTSNRNRDRPPPPLPRQINLSIMSCLAAWKLASTFACSPWPVIRRFAKAVTNQARFDALEPG